MRVSLVMPNYNHAPFLERSLGAMLRQERAADEIILIDDGSTDHSPSIIARAMSALPHAKIVCRAERLGVLRTLNEGLELASGDLIAFPAADDLLFPGFLKETEHLLARSPEAAFCSACVELRDEHDQVVGLRPLLRPTRERSYVSAHAARRLLASGDNFFMGAVTLYRRDKLLQLGGFEAALGATADGMMQRRLAVRWGFCFIPEVLGVWRIHGANFSLAAVDSPRSVDDLLARNLTVLEQEPHGLFPPDYKELFERRFRFNAARLAAHQIARRPEAIEATRAMMKGGPADARILAALSLVKPWAAALVTGWLAVRLRPFSYLWLGREAVRRIWRRLAGLEKA